MLITDLFCV